MTSKTTNSSGTTTYTWTKDDDGTIKRNNVYGFFTVKYGESVDLVNYNNENYLLIKRSGYKGRDGLGNGHYDGQVHPEIRGTVQFGTFLQLLGNAEEVGTEQGDTHTGSQEGYDLCLIAVEPL